MLFKKMIHFAKDPSDIIISHTHITCFFSFFFFKFSVFFIQKHRNSSLFSGTHKLSPEYKKKFLHFFRTTFQIWNDDDNNNNGYMWMIFTTNREMAKTKTCHKFTNEKNIINVWCVCVPIEFWSKRNLNGMEWKMTQEWCNWKYMPPPPNHQIE